MKKHKKKGKKQAGEPGGLVLEQDAVAEPVSGDAAASASAGQGRTQKRQERRRVVNEDLRLELETLRHSVVEMLSRYQLKLEAELVQLAEATSANGGLDSNGRRLPTAVAENMLKQIRALEIKATKGRAKDFQRVQDLVGDLIEQLPSEK